MLKNCMTFWMIDSHGEYKTKQAQKENGYEHLKRQELEVD